MHVNAINLGKRTPPVQETYGISSIRIVITLDQAISRVIIIIIMLEIRVHATTTTALLDTSTSKTKVKIKVKICVIIKTLIALKVYSKIRNNANRL